MKNTLIAVLFASFIILTGCNTGCGGSSWGNSYSSSSYASAGCGAATCCGSGSW